MNIYITLIVEFVLIVSSILLFYKYRATIGLAPLYILLGSLQYLQTLSGTLVSVEIFNGITIYPGSAIIFSAGLFAVLLIYIKEGVIVARNLIFGIVLSNFLLVAFFTLTRYQELASTVNTNIETSVFSINYKNFLKGTLILLVDYILMVIVYQFVVSKIRKAPLFLSLFIALSITLIFDAFAFNFALFYGTPIFENSLISHLIVKPIFALIYSFVLYFFIKYIDAEKLKIAFVSHQDRDVLSILKYRKKYDNLKIEKNKIEQKLNHQIKTTLNNISDGFVSLDTKWCYIYANIKAGEFVGRTPESLIGRHIWTEFPDSIRSQFYKACHKAVETQETQLIQEYSESLKIWFENRIYPSQEGLTIYFTDISEIKEADTNNLMLLSLIETSDDFIGLATLDGHPIYLNTNGRELVGLEHNEIMPDSISDFFPENYQDIIVNKHMSSIFTHNKWSGESHFKNFKTGNSIPIEMSGFLIENNKTNEPVALGIVATDITRRKTAETKLIEDEKSLVIAQKLAKIGSFSLDLVTRKIQGSASFMEILSINKSTDFTADLWKTLIHPKDVLVNLKRFQKCLETDDTFDMEFRILTENHTTLKWIHGLGEFTFINGEAVNFYGTAQDISDRIDAQKQLDNRAQWAIEKKDILFKLSGLSGEDFIGSIKIIVKEAAVTLNVARVSIWKFNEERTEAYGQQLYQLENDSYSDGYVLRAEDNPNYFEALNLHQTILVSDVLTDSITKKFADDYLIPNNIASLMDVFINSTDGFYGIICFEHIGKKRTWTPSEQEFAISITNIVSLMVQSSERLQAENRTILANEKLTHVNKELNTLRKQLEQENVYLRNELDLVFNYEEMVYGSAAFSNVLSEIEKVAPTNATVLLLGESGTGKELLARALHNTSQRNKKPLIKINCSAIPKELIESELFGHKKGSFTGAFSDKVGKLELADGGTLFLDEIGDLPLDMQPKILRFLQEGEIEVVGGIESKKLDVRVIAATHLNLKKQIEKKKFREDLFFRLNVFPIVVPPLRKRKEDIPLLVEHFVEKFNMAYSKDILYITDDAMNQLKNYKWPGNVRELENLIERASIISNGNTLVIPGFETIAQGLRTSINNRDTSLETVQREHIVRVLEQCAWKVSGPNGASILLDIKPSTLRDKMTKLGISKPSPL